MRLGVAHGPLYTLLLVFLLLLMAVPASAVDVLVILPNHYGTNYFLASKTMNEYGWNVTLAGLEDPVQPCTWADNIAGDPMPVDILISEIEDVTIYDAVVVLSSSAWVANAYGDLCNSFETLWLLSQANEAGIPICGWCGATRVFAAAAIVSGRDVTGHANFVDEYIAAGANFLGAELPPVIDGNLMTCTRGMYFHHINMEAFADLVEQSQITDEKEGGER